MENQGQATSKYHVATRKHGTTTEVAKRMQDVADLYEERIDIEEKENEGFGKWILIFLFCVPLGAFVAADLYLIPGLALVAVPFIVLLLMKMKKDKILKVFEDKVLKVTENDLYPNFGWSEWYGHERLRFYTRKARGFEWVRAKVGECDVYELDHPLLPNVTLPEGIELYTYWLFKKGDKLFQIALNESGLVGESYMILPIDDRPVAFEGLQIKQTVGL